MPTNIIISTDVLKFSESSDNTSQSQALINYFRKNSDSLNKINAHIYINGRLIEFQNASLLHIAAALDNPALIIYLLEKEELAINATCVHKTFDKNGRNSESTSGNTPLHLAARYNASAAISTLLNCEADKTLIDTAGNSPIALASDENKKLFSNASDRIHNIYQQKAYQIDARAILIALEGVVLASLVFFAIIFPPVGLTDSFGLTLTKILAISAGLGIIGLTAAVDFSITSKALRRNQEILNQTLELNESVKDQLQKSISPPIKSSQRSFLKNIHQRGITKAGLGTDEADQSITQGEYYQPILSYTEKDNYQEDSVKPEELKSNDKSFNSQPG